MSGHTVLQVPVPQLESFVRARTEYYDRDYLFVGPAAVQAHITALGPFVEPSDLSESAIRRIEQVTGSTEPFDYRLAALDTFPNGIIHLLPEPEEPFRTLTARLFEAFPSHPPYAAQFADVRPHLTLDARSRDVSESSTRALLGDLVPTRCRAAQLDLAWYEASNCRVLRSWPLGAVTGRRA